MLPGLSSAQAPKRDMSLSNYRLGSGDVITIEVLGEDDLKRDRIRLSDAATISYPILGEIHLSGKTVGELERIIREGLRGRYLVNPQVTVTRITSYNVCYTKLLRCCSSRPPRPAWRAPRSPPRAAAPT